MKITYNQALNAFKVINEKFSDVTGDLALKVYFWKHAIREAFAPYDEIRNEKMRGVQALAPKGESKPSQKYKEAVQEANQTIQDLGKKEEKVECRKDPVTLAELKEHELDSVEVLSALDFMIDMEAEQVGPSKNGKAKA